MTPTIRELSALVKAVKSDICDDYRAFDDDEMPGIQLTVAMNDDKEWNYQTGDNSYMGSCYHFPYWAVVGVYRNSNSVELAHEIQAELADNSALAMDDSQFTDLCN